MKFNDYVQENGHLTKTGKTWMQGIIHNMKNALPTDMSIQEMEIMQALMSSEINKYFSLEINKIMIKENKYQNSKFASMTDEEFKKYLEDKNGTGPLSILVSLTEEEMMRYERTQEWQNKKLEIAQVIKDMGNNRELPANGVRFDK